MQLKAGMACQPALDGGMFMGGVVVQNDVDVLAQRNFAVDLLEKLQPLAVGVCWGGVNWRSCSFSAELNTSFPRCLDIENIQAFSCQNVTII